MADLDRLEDDLTQERAVLAARLDALSGRFAPERLVDDATCAAGNIVGRGLGRAKILPTAPVLASVLSLAWAAGASVASARRQRAIRPYDQTSRPTAKGFPQSPSDPSEFDARVARADAAMRKELASPHQRGADTMTTKDHETNTDESAAAMMKERAYATAEVLRARLEDGLDGLPDAAKQRIRQARKAAVAAQSEIESRARQAADAARTTARDNPLLVGALAFAAGAAIAAALPRTSIENRTMGAHRDRLFDDAERIYREERAALTSAAEAALETGRKNVMAAQSDAARGDKTTKAAKAQAAASA